MNHRKLEDLIFLGPGCVFTMVVDSMERILVEAGEGKEIIYEPEVFQSTQAGIPVTLQRRFDVYPDISRF